VYDVKEKESEFLAV